MGLIPLYIVSSGLLVSWIAGHDLKSISGLKELGPVYSLNKNTGFTARLTSSDPCSSMYFCIILPL